MGWLITNRGNIKIESHASRVLFNDEELSSRELAKILNVVQPTISNRIKKCANGLITYDDLISNRDTRIITSKVDGEILSAKDISEITGFSKPSITARMHKYNDGEITVDQLMKVKKVTLFDKIPGKRKFKSAKVERSNKFKEQQKTKDHDYRIMLRQHKLGSAAI